jgi:hypothetical protein
MLTMWDYPTFRASRINIRLPQRLDFIDESA